MNVTQNLIPDGSFFTAQGRGYITGRRSHRGAVFFKITYKAEPIVFTVKSYNDELPRVFENPDEIWHGVEYLEVQV